MREKMRLLPDKVIVDKPDCTLPEERPAHAVLNDATITRCQSTNRKRLYDLTSGFRAQLNTNHRLEDKYKQKKSFYIQMISIFCKIVYASQRTIQAKK
ncbi:hypothetical protein J6590_053600 [Homalodisca vitripennis]|nr:hypothetical protein J6590_053600 [Homalodisca vitripennis]